MSTALKVVGGVGALALFSGPMLLGMAALTPIMAASGKVQPVAASACTVLAASTPDRAGIVATIVKVGQSMDVPQAGWTIAVAVGIVESGLRNLDYGDLDSLGVFQQRGSWGTTAQRRDVAYAAGKFYTALKAIDGWESMPPGEAAAAVQRPADQYRGRYATKMQEAALLVAGAPAGQPCPAAQPASGGSGSFTDGPATPGLPPLPRTAAQAIAWARDQAASGPSTWYRQCLSFVAQAWGLRYSGTQYAIDHWGVIPPQYRHPGDRHPEPGALLFWETGNRAGHVAISVGGGQIASNDIEQNGHISIVNADEIEARWGATYVGWASAVFPNGG